MKKLNGWYRIGVVLSVLWSVGATVYVNRIIDRSAVSDALYFHGTCMDQVERLGDDKQDAAIDECNAQRDKFIDSIKSETWWQPFAISGGTLLLAWCLVLGSIKILRWIHDGFSKA